MTATATVKALPAFVKRITSADVESGDIVSGFYVWPTSRPAVTLERGEKVDITLRLKPETGSPATLALGPDAPDICKLRYDKNSNTYWLDIKVGPVDASISRALPLLVTGPNGALIKLTVNLAIDVPAENLIVTPRELDLGEIALSSLKIGTQKIGRVGIRKLVGSFHIKPPSSTLTFLKVDLETIVEGSNYVLRTRFDLVQIPKAGAYAGKLVIETDDGKRLEVPIKLAIVDR
ncbi:MAG TPA: hypothetical protein VNS63_25805 [Blastocatellia bacterium]|nr:hypothetical protein [Blastocatellia bacterium]